MRLFEFDDAVNASVMGLLAHLKRKAEGKTGAKINTKSFLGMLANLGVKVDANGLDQLRSKNPAIGNLVSSVDDEYVQLNTTGETQDDSFDDLDIADAGDDAEMDDLGLDEPMDDQAGVTTDDFEQPDMGMGQQNPMNTVSGMAKRALSRRQ